MNNKLREINERMNNNVITMRFLTKKEDYCITHKKPTLINGTGLMSHNQELVECRLMLFIAFNL